MLVLNPQEEIIKLIREWAKNHIETKAPAVITDDSKYGSDRVLTVQPLVIEKEDDGDQVVPDQIYSCPVILDGCADGHMSFPFKVGDIVAIGYCKRSIEEVTYGNSNQQVVPDDDRVFSASDAVVLGYWAQPANSSPVSTENFEIKFANSEVSISPSNVITITNGDLTVAIDGASCSISNSSGSWELQPNGEIIQNGATVDTTGNYISATGTDLDNLKANFDAFVLNYNAHGSGASNHPPSFVPTPP